MSFTSINEPDQFSYEDCGISRYEHSNGRMVLELEALIVKAGNSQNTNYTESYADTATAEFGHPEVTELVKEGYKYYDANDRLVEDVPDETMDLSGAEAFLKSCVGAYLYEVVQVEEGVYRLGIEFPGEDEYDNTGTTCYHLILRSDRFQVSWDRYLNRVQH